MTLQLTLEELSSRLEADSGVDWWAGHTPVVGRLTEVADEDIAVFGLSLTGEEILQEKLDADAAPRFAVTRKPPRKIDWRAERGADWLSPVRDQGVCGACVAFAVVGVIEGRVRLLRDDPRLAIALSEADLFFCGAGPACRRGWGFKPALKRCRDHGVGSAAAFPYAPMDQACRSIPGVARIESYDTQSSLALRKAAVAERGPVVAGMRVFEDISFYKGGIYKHVAGDFRGLHAVCVVGYDDDQQCWIVRNSWGTGWGEAGYLQIGYGECGLDTEFVFYDPVVAYEPGGFR